MAQILKPANLSLTWASGGDILNPGDAKYATGWQVEIPPRQWFNYLDNRQDTAIAHINQHGVAVWDASTEYQANKSYVQGPTNGTIYRCVQTHTNQNPETDVTNTYWIVAFASAGDFYTKTESDGRYLAKSQNLSDLTNTATARNNLNVYSKAETYSKSETYNKAEVDAKTTVASTAQAQALASDTTLLTPKKLGDAMNAYVLGMGQTWQDVTASRTHGVTYTNTTGRTIMVYIAFDPFATSSTITLGSVQMPFLVDSYREYASFIVPPGLTYMLSNAGALSLFTWLELR